MSFGGGEDRDQTRSEIPARRLPLVGLALGLGVVVGVGLGFPLWRARLAEPQREVAATPAPLPPPPPSTERQIAARRLAAFDVAPLAPTDPPAIVIDDFVDTRRTTPPYWPLDAVVFDTTEVRVRVAGVWPVARNEVCIDAQDLRIACGLMGRAALQNFISGKTVVCREHFTAGRREPELLVADCSVEGQDVADHMVRAGFAFPVREGGIVETPALAEARKARRGVWIGPYDLPKRDRAPEDMSANPYVAPTPVGTEEMPARR